MQATDEVEEQFYEKLDEPQHLKRPANKSLIILGNFNARVDWDYKAWNGVIGIHGAGKMNSNIESYY